jgi:hypothetical protein
VVPAPDDVSAAKARRTCRSRRQFTLTLYRGRSHVRRATVTLNGKRVKASRNRRKVRITLTGRRSGVARVRVSLRLAGGRTLRFTRRYAMCAPRRPRS